MNPCSPRLARLVIIPLMLPLLFACGQGKPDQAQLAEGFDLRNRPQTFGLETMRYAELARPSAQQGYLDFRPWQDSYWPFYKQSLAYRYTTNGFFTSAYEQTSDALLNPSAIHLSPAEKYDLLMGDPSFSMTHESWDNYQRYAGRPSNAWHWMGVCSGWAPASIREPAPRHHVLASVSGGKDVLFYTGDLRGLMSKVYDFNQLEGGHSMIGSRCEMSSAQVPRDEQGRPIDGRMSATGQQLWIVNDYAWEHGVLEVRTAPNSSQTKFLVFNGRIDKIFGNHDVWVYETRENAVADIQAGTRGQRSDTGIQTQLQLFKSCRDINAAALHLTLAQQLSDAAIVKSPFIIEINRYHEVWNHPIVAFKTELGAAIPLGLDDAARRPFRARGTTHIAKAATYLFYVPGWARPVAQHTHDNAAPIDLNDLNSLKERYGMMTLRYSLEFNADGELIGGEWIEPVSGGSGVPDFIWRPAGAPSDQRKSGGESPLKYSVIKRLFDCSLAEPDSSIDTSTNGGSLTPLPVVRCAL